MGDPTEVVGRGALTQNPGGGSRDGVAGALRRSGDVATVKASGRNTAPPGDVAPTQFEVSTRTLLDATAVMAASSAAASPSGGKTTWELRAIARFAGASRSGAPDEIWPRILTCIQSTHLACADVPCGWVESLQCMPLRSFSGWANRPTL